MSARQPISRPVRRRLRVTIACLAGMTVGFLIAHFIVTPLLFLRAGG